MSQPFRYGDSRDPEGRGFVQQEYLPAQQTVPPQYAPNQRYPQQPAYVPQQGYPMQQQTYGQQTTVVVNPSAPAMPLQHADHMGFSIFTMLCCCFCIGIAAVFQSCSTREANARGDANAAQLHSRQALTLNKVALGIGIGTHAIWVVTLVVLLVTGAALFASVSDDASIEFADSYVHDSITPLY